VCVCVCPLQRSNDENGNCSSGSMEFPTTNLYELESRVFTDHWSIPYKREESLGKCLIASTCLARHGKCVSVRVRVRVRVQCCFCEKCGMRQPFCCRGSREKHIAALRLVGCVGGMFLFWASWVASHIAGVSQLKLSVDFAVFRIGGHDRVGRAE